MAVGPGPRFLIEAVFIVAVAVIAAISKLSTLGIILSIGAAWALVAAVEWTASRHAGAAAVGDVPTPSAGARRPLFGRRRAPGEAPTIAPEPVAAPAADDPALQHVRVLPVAAPLEEPPAGPPPAAEPEPVAARPLAEAIEAPPPAAEEPSAPEPVPAAAFVEPRPEPTPEPAPDPAPPPPPEPEPIPVAPPVLAAAPPLPPEPVAPPPAPAAPPQVVSIGPRGPVAWNLWELERLSREHAGQDTFKDEERSYLLIYLREFASADGILPADFDGLVRDSFGDLVSTG
jgi:hypothetical protein